MAIQSQNHFQQVVLKWKKKYLAGRNLMFCAKCLVYSLSVFDLIMQRRTM